MSEKNIEAKLNGKTASAAMENSGGFIIQEEAVIVNSFCSGEGKHLLFSGKQTQLYSI